jgi:hypothetical protein
MNEKELNMKRLKFYIPLFFALLFLYGCYSYEDDMNITFVNKSSYDLYINLKMKQKESQHNGDVKKGESLSFGIIFSGEAVIVVPVDRNAFHKLNDHIVKITFYNLDNFEIIKEMDSINPEYFSFDQGSRTYITQITDDLLF